MLKSYVKKFSFKIPNYISVFYFKKKNVLILKKNKTIRFLSINSQLNFLIFKNRVFIFVTFLKNFSENRKNKLKYLKKKYLANLKEFLIEIQIKIYNKLKLVGIGYKILKTNYKNILMFKLGFSHPIYFKLNFTFSITKFTNLFIFGNFLNKIIIAGGLIKILKKVEPYKGKGISYENEIIKIKQTKKT